jgi:hypothetical protein
MMPCKPDISIDIVYLIDGEDGIWMIEDYEDSKQIHVDMAPGCRGKKALDKCKLAIKWAFDNLEIEVLYGLIPKENRPACHNAIHAGMTFSHETESNRVYKVKK